MFKGGTLQRIKSPVTRIESRKTIQHKKEKRAGHLPGALEFKLERQLKYSRGSVT